MITGDQPGLWVLASAKFSPFQASQGSPCSRGLAWAISNLVWEIIEKETMLPGQVRKHFVHRSVWNVLVHAETCLAWENLKKKLRKVAPVRLVLPRGKERLSHIPKSCPKQITWDKKLQLKSKRSQPCPRAWCCSSASAGGWTWPCPHCGRPPSLPPSEEKLDQCRGKKLTRFKHKKRGEIAAFLVLFGLLSFEGVVIAI